MAASEWVNLRVTGAEKKRAEDVIESVRRECPILTRAQVLRAALREGLVALGKNPKRAVQVASAS